jgi:hydrogenase maturation protease
MARGADERMQHDGQVGSTGPFARRTLIAGIGYRNLRDFSAGNAVVDALLASHPHLRPAPGTPPNLQPSTFNLQPVNLQPAEVEDLSYGPMDAIYRLREAGFDRLIVVGAVARPGRIPGEVYRRRWRYEPEPPELVQARVAEAVTGVISLDNLLVICAHFEALPPEVTVIEIEPEDGGWGEGFSTRVERAIERIVAQLSAEFGARNAE